MAVSTITQSGQGAVLGTLSSSHTLASGQCYLVKVGRVVFLTMGITLTSAVSSYGVIATIPSGFRPYAQMWGTNRGNAYDITAGGNIRLIDSTASGTSLNISATYITA